MSNFKIIICSNKANTEFKLCLSRLAYFGYTAENLQIYETSPVNYTFNRYILDKYNIPTVPILKTDYILPDTVEELLDYAAAPSELDGLPREGVVFRNINDPTISFKAVDNAFIDKYH